MGPTIITLHQTLYIVTSQLYGSNYHNIASNIIHSNITVIWVELS